MSVETVGGEGESEDLDPGPGGLGDGQRRVRRVEHPGEVLDLAAWVSRGHKVLDLDVDQLTDLDRMAPPVVDVVDRSRLCLL
jgi:hypothetical protein